VLVLVIASSRDDHHKHGAGQALGKNDSAGMRRSAKLRHMRVLIADDQKSVGTSLAELVRLCHHEVVEVVGSGLEAIHAYGRHRPDVVLMDYQMPKLNGATACRNIMAKHPNARVILVSGSPKEIAGSGALALLIKPVKLDQLYAALYDAAHPPNSDVQQH
jgi:CheY-like chemotaxis protein